MNKNQMGEIYLPKENADIEYILDLFDNKELGLTIAEDNQESERSSTVYLKSQENKEEMSEATYKAAFTSFFKNNRKEAVSFIDGAIRFMNALKQMKIEELLTYVSEPKAFDQILENFITPELLIEPIEQELAFKKLTENDRSLYEQSLKLLKQQGELTIETKEKIRRLLQQVQSS